MKKNGFTLIELLVVITILALIVILIFPVVNGLIENSRIESFKNSVFNTMDAISEDLGIDNFEIFPEDGILANSDIESLEKNPFISGVFYLIDGNITASNVSDGKYCANGSKEDLKVTKGECHLLDDTAPSNITLTPSKISSNSFKVIVEANEEESAIAKYEYSIDGGKTYPYKSNSNVYTFNKLTKNTTYPVKVKVTNLAGLSGESSTLNVKTTNFSAPTFTSNPSLGSWSHNKTVTIIYPTDIEDLKYDYSLDMGKTWIRLSKGNTVDIFVDKETTIIARVQDGFDPNKEETATLVVNNFDKTAPNVPTANIRIGSSSGTIRSNTTTYINQTLWWGNFSAVDPVGEISHYEYSANCTGSSSGTISSKTYSSTTASSACLRAVDKAGNKSAWSGRYYFYVDKTAPTVPSINLNGYTSGNWTNQNVSQTVTGGSDAHSGFNRYEYSHDKSGFANMPSNPFVVANQNQYFYYRSVDNAGNKSAWSSGVLIKQDHSRPNSPKFERAWLLYPTNSSRYTIDYSNCIGKGGKNYDEACTIYVNDQVYFNWDIKFDEGDPGIGEFTWTHSGGAHTGGDYCETWTTLAEANTKCSHFEGKFDASPLTSWTWVKARERTVDKAGNVGYYLEMNVVVR